jgi:hypothetical protein
MLAGHTIRAYMPSSLQTVTHDIYLTIDLFIARGTALYDTFNLRAYPEFPETVHK